MSSLTARFRLDLLAQPRRAGADARVPGGGSARVPRRRVGPPAAGDRAASFLQRDGRLAGPRRPHRLPLAEGGDRPLRPPARGAHPGRARSTSRPRCELGGARARPARDQPTTAGRSRSRATPSIRDSLGAPSPSRRPACSSSTIRTAAGTSVLRARRPGLRQELGRRSRADARAASCTARGGEGLAVLAEAIVVAEPAQAARAPARGAARGRVVRVRAGLAATTSGTGCARPSAARCGSLPHLERARVIACFDADLLFEHPAALRLRPATSPRRAIRRPAGRHEPALRGGGGLLAHRRSRRPPAAPCRHRRSPACWRRSRAP